MKKIFKMIDRLIEIEPDVWTFNEEVSGAFVLTSSLCPGSFYCEPETYFVEPESWAHLQAMLQQAIEARGWTWRIEFNHVHKSWSADVDHDFGEYTSDSRESPAEALLAAYLQAIEATAEVVS